MSRSKSALSYEIMMLTDALCTILLYLMLRFVPLETRHAPRLHMWLWMCRIASHCTSRFVSCHHSGASGSSFHLPLGSCFWLTLFLTMSSYIHSKMFFFKIAHSQLVLSNIIWVTDIMHNYSLMLNSIILFNLWNKAESALYLYFHCFIPKLLHRSNIWKTVQHSIPVNINAIYVNYIL